MARSSPRTRSTDKAFGRHPATAPVSERGIKNTGTDEFRTILEACDPRKNRLIAELLVPMASTSPSPHGMSAKASAQEVPCPTTVSTRVATEPF